MVARSGNALSKAAASACSSFQRASAPRRAQVRMSVECLAIQVMLCSSAKRAQPAELNASGMTCLDCILPSSERSSDYAEARPASLCLALFGPERTERIDVSGPACGEPDGDQCDGAQEQGGRDKDGGLQSGDDKEEARDDAREAEPRRKPNDASLQRDPHALTNDHVPDRVRFGAECHANA